jgi:trk system potassium uptake protein
MGIGTIRSWLPPVNRPLTHGQRVSRRSAGAAAGRDDVPSRSWLHSWDVRRRRAPSFWQRLTAPQIFVGSFLVLIGAGTIGLRTLPGLYTGEGLGWLDALFTATSAVCVTGLIVVDTATYFTPAGQAFLLLLIQLGGLGIIAFTTVIIAALGRRLSLRHRKLAGNSAEIIPELDYGRLTRDIVLFTLALEALGAVLLYILWVPRFGVSGAAWPAVFHAISAFCNAGFSTFSDSLTGFQEAPWTLGVIMALIVVGGIGFLVLEELYMRARRELTGRRIRLSLHSRLVLATTAILIVVPWLLFTAFEWRITFAHLDDGARVLNGLFMSVTARTGGFNTVDYGDAAVNSNFLTMLLMFVGGSPGSTAGGMKTTTVALVGLLAWARLRGRTDVRLWDRSIREESVQRAVGLIVMGVGLIIAAILVYSTTELGRVGAPDVAGGFLAFAFEAVSAINTVGLSMGVTADLTASGKALTILLMFLGRVGPITFAAALALAASPRRRRVRYAHEEVVIG